MKSRLLSWNKHMSGAAIKKKSFNLRRNKWLLPFCVCVLTIEIPFTWA